MEDLEKVVNEFYDDIDKTFKKSDINEVMMTISYCVEKYDEHCLGECSKHDAEVIFIEKALDDLQKENKQLKDKLNKIDNQAKTQISIIKSQPSPNKEADDYFVARLETISKIIKGEE